VKNMVAKSYQFILLIFTASFVLFFYFQTQILDLDSHNIKSQDLLHLRQLDTLLEEEALKATSLQLNNYDEFVSIVSQIKILTTKVSSPSSGIYNHISQNINKDIDGLKMMVNKKIYLIEGIKSHMAIVRNVISFLPLEIIRITQQRKSPIHHNYQQLIITLLAYNINPTPANLKLFQRSIDQLKAIKNAVSTASQVKATITLLLLHANANLKSNSRTSELFNELKRLPIRDTIERIFVAHASHVVNQIKKANQFRSALLVLSMILFTSLGYALYSLRIARNLAEKTSKQFMDAAESISEGFAFFDNSGNLQFWNNKFNTMHEACGDVLKAGVSFLDFFNTCVSCGIYEKIAIDNNSLKTPSPDDVRGSHYTIHGKDGTWMLASDSPMENGGTACVRIDITANKHAEAEMRKLSRAVEQSPASVMITDTLGNIVYVNPKFTETTGYLAHEAIGQKPSLISSGERSPQDYYELWQTITSGREWRGEFHNKRKDGTLFWEFASLSPIQDENGEITHFLGIKENITDRKKTMEELVQAKESAELANHSKTQFLANMSHELRTPLNAIIGFSEILKEQMFGPLGSDQYVDYTSSIYDSGKHLLDVINDILDVSRIEIGNMEIRENDVNLSLLCLSCADMILERAQFNGLTLNSELPEDNIHVKGDEIRIKQIILNLLTNAVKFTPKGGFVTIKAYINDNNQAVLLVSDTGIGISKELHQKILEPFEQIGDIYNRDHEGSGLGLYLVKAFIQLHDGDFSIDSKPETGSTFTMKLPPTRTIISDKNSAT